MKTVYFLGLVWILDIVWIWANLVAKASLRSSQGPTTIHEQPIEIHKIKTFIILTSFM